MFNKTIKTALLITASISLAACGFNPQSAHLSKRQQCLSLQHKMLFSNSFNPAKSSEFKNRTQRQDLSKEFHAMHCYNVLEKARSSQPKK